METTIHRTHCSSEHDERVECRGLRDVQAPCLHPWWDTVKLGFGSNDHIVDGYTAAAFADAGVARKFETVQVQCLTRGREK